MRSTNNRFNEVLETIFSEHAGVADCVVGAGESALEVGARRLLSLAVIVLLNHAGSSVTDIYTRANLLEQKRDAVERLGRLFVGVGEEEEITNRVVYLNSARI